MHFPPRYSSTENDTITLRGVVLNTSGVNQVYINDEPVSSSDGLATWTYTTNLAWGENELVISEETDDGVTEIDQVIVERASSFITPRVILDDDTNNRLLILDRGKNSIIAVDKTSGNRFPLSPQPGVTNQITNARGMLLDTERNRVVLYQVRFNATDLHPEFLAVDLTSGEQSALDFPDFDNIYLNHTTDVMTISGNTAFVADIQTKYYDASRNEVPFGSDKIVSNASTPIIYSINLTTGVRTVISAVDKPATAENPLSVVSALAYNPTTATLYALDTGQTNPRLLAININDGKRTLLSVQQGSDSFPLRIPSAIEMDVARQRLLLLNTNNPEKFDDRAPAVAAIDLATKKATYLTSNTVPANGAYVLRMITDMTYSAADNVVYLLDTTQQVIFRVNGETGVRTVAAAIGPVDEKDYIGNRVPLDIFLATDHQVYLTDEKLSSVFGYNLYFGAKDVLTNSSIDNLEPKDELIRKPVQGTWDPLNEKILLANGDNGVLVAFDPLTRNAENVLSFGAVASDMVTDAEAGITYLATRTNVIKVDLNKDYSATYFSGRGIPDDVNYFLTIRAIALDKERNRLLVADSEINAVLAVDLTSGTRTYISPPSTTPEQEGGLRLPRAITMDTANNRALILDTGRQAIMGVDLTSGERSVVYSFGNQVPRQLLSPPMVMHPTFQYLLLMEKTNNVLVALDLNTTPPQLVTLTR